MSKYDIVIIDGNNFLFRAFYNKRPERIINGINYAPIHQFFLMFQRVLSNFTPDEVYFTWDKKLDPSKPNFRKELIAYKAHREETEEKKKMFESIPIIQEILDNMGVKTVYPVSLEGDDVIFFFSQIASPDKTKIIISPDQDLLQLVDNKTHVFLPVKQKLITLDNFEEEIKIKKEHFILYKTIIGDTSDNIPGLYGYGPVKARQLIEDIKDEILNPFSRTDKITNEQVDILARNHQIMDLTYSFTRNPDEFNHFQKQLDESSTEYNSIKLRELFTSYNFHDFLRGIGTWTALLNKKGDFDLLSHLVM